MNSSGFGGRETWAEPGPGLVWDALATAFGEKAHEPAHGLEIGSVDSRAPVALAKDQPSAPQFFQVKGEGGRGKVENLGDPAGLEPFVAASHEQAKDIESGFLGKSSQSTDGDLFFHTSKYIEI